jgi:hypothetical protein
MAVCVYRRVKIQTIRYRAVKLRKGIPLLMIPRVHRDDARLTDACPDPVKLSRSHMCERIRAEEVSSVTKRATPEPAIPAQAFE